MNFVAIHQACHLNALAILANGFDAFGIVNDVPGSNGDAFTQGQERRAGESFPLPIHDLESKDGGGDPLIDLFRLQILGKDWLGCRRKEDQKQNFN